MLTKTERTQVLGALKAYGRIIKSLFILTYIDDVELRQAIEKQLNKVEHSHKFARAVFYGGNQEFLQAVDSERYYPLELPLSLQEDPGRKG